MFGKSFPLHHVSRSKTTSLAYYFHSNITNVNATYSHQRPPSVGMPRHALRRRMPNSAAGRPQFPLGGRGYFPANFAARGGTRSAAQVILKNVPKKMITRKAISKPTRRIPLNFCIHLRITVVRKSQQGRFQF